MGETACGYVKNIGREGEAVHLLDTGRTGKDTGGYVYDRIYWK